MIATHNIKVNGRWYSAGEEIPEEDCYSFYVPEEKPEKKPEAKPVKVEQKVEEPMQEEPKAEKPAHKTTPSRRKKASD